MVAAKKPTSVAHTDRLLALYRAELDHWNALELLEDLLRLPNMPKRTFAACWAKIDRPRCSRATAVRLAEAAIREMADLGHAGEVASLLGQLAEQRAEAQARDVLSRLVKRLAERQAHGARAAKVMAAIETARCVDETSPRTERDRRAGDRSSTELLLTAAIEAADQAELAAMLEAVLSVASDRVVDAVCAEREDEERMLAEYRAEQRAA